MAGSLTLGGMADGLLAGQITIGPSTIAGKAANSEMLNVELVANIDTVVKVPPEAVAFAVLFTFAATSPAEVKIRTNLNNADVGLPVPASGWLQMPVASGVTELKFKAASPTAFFQLVFV
jgi:hypothetical protein